MNKLSLSMACSEYPRTRPILDGSVSPEGVNLFVSRFHPADTFARAFKAHDFDITEMSLSSLIIATSRGESRWTAIPVFPCRGFFHTWVLCNSRSKIEGPSDLRRKRFALHEYQMTAGVWIRGILQHEFKVKPAEILWFQERGQHRIPVRLPKDLMLRTIPPDKNKYQMLANGEVDAALYGALGAALDRPSVHLLGRKNIRWLFKDTKAEEERFFKKTGIFPMNHVVAVKREIAERHPWVPLNLYIAFQRAKEVASKSLNTIDFLSAPDVVWQRFALEEQREIFGDDAYPYGFRANEKCISTLASYCWEQGLAEGKVPPQDLFYPATFDT